MSEPDDFSGSDGRIKITSEHERRFLKEAPIALARRTHSYMTTQVLQTLQWLVIGVTGLFGLFFWHWSPLALLLIFLLGNFVGIVLDLLRAVLDRRRVIKELDRIYQDQFVWNMVMAKQFGRDTINKDVTGTHSLSVLIFIDVLFGSIAAVACYFGVKKMNLDLTAELFASPGLQIALIGIVVIPTFNLLQSFFKTAHNKSNESVTIASGGRGFGLFFLMFALGAFSDSPDMIRNGMIVINALTVFLGLIALLGVVIMIREKHWLIKFLATQNKLIVGSQDNRH